jgi:DNA-binding IclR family transcriptional regulator
MSRKRTILHQPQVATAHAGADGASSEIAEKAERYHLRGVTRALDILSAVGASPGRHELAALSRCVGLHPVTVLRHLESSKSRGFVRQRPKGHELGSRLFELGTAFLDRVSTSTYANDLTQELVAITHETASVGVLDEHEILYISIAHWPA